MVFGNKGQFCTYFDEAHFKNAYERFTKKTQCHTFSLTHINCAYHIIRNLVLYKIFK